MSSTIVPPFSDHGTIFARRDPSSSFINDSVADLDMAMANLRRKREEAQIKPELLALSKAQVLKGLTFCPEEHLNFEEYPKIHTMEEIGMCHKGVSNTAVSEPFQLFTEEAIAEMRAEVLSLPVLKNCQYSSNIAQCQLRGHSPKFGEFTYDVWHNPKVLEIISKIAGVELVPQFDFEIGHINISINTKESKAAEKKALAEYASRQADEGVAGCPWEDDAPIVDWHTDSYPFVCVTMLSDCTGMVGGETALRKGDGGIMKVRGPVMGNAVILQGRYIEHQALRALGCPERITMVTSFRPKSAFIKDDTVLTTVRAVSDIPALYSQYAEYRLEMLEERTRAKLRELRENKARRWDTTATKAWIAEQQAFLESMMKELVDDDKVTIGFTDDAHLLSVDLKDKARKRVKVLNGDMNGASNGE